MSSLSNVWFINIYFCWYYLTWISHNINSRHSAFLLIISSTVFVPSVSISWTVSVCRLYKVKFNELPIIKLVIYFVCCERYFKVTVWVNSFKLRWLNIPCLINLLKNKYILSTQKCRFKNKSACCWWRAAEDLMSLITKNFITDSAWNYYLYSLFFYCSFMNYWKIYNIFLRVNCAFIPRLKNIACLRRSTLHFSNYSYYLRRFALHSILKGSLYMIFRSSSYTIVMLHYRQKLIWGN